jgi:hypothetical protein
MPADTTSQFLIPFAILPVQKVFMDQNRSGDLGRYLRMAVEIEL